MLARVLRCSPWNRVLKTGFLKACAGPEVLPVEPSSEDRVSEGLVPPCATVFHWVPLSVRVPPCPP
jgi:hypothetical protein